MLSWSMTSLAHIPERDLFHIDSGDGETDRIPVTLRRDARTGVCVAKIAEIPETGIVGSKGLVRGAAGTAPACSQRQSGGMRPRPVVQNLPRHKKGTGQVASPEKSHCNAWERGINVD